jgi:hypothetical protein
MTPKTSKKEAEERLQTILASQILVGDSVDWVMDRETLGLALPSSKINIGVVDLVMEQAGKLTKFRATVSLEMPIRGWR